MSNPLFSREKKRKTKNAKEPSRCFVGGLFTQHWCIDTGFLEMRYDHIFCRRHLRSLSPKFEFFLQKSCAIHPLRVVVASDLRSTIPGHFAHLTTYCEFFPLLFSSPPPPALVCCLEETRAWLRRGLPQRRAERGQSPETSGQREFPQRWRTTSGQSPKILEKDQKMSSKMAHQNWSVSPQSIRMAARLQDDIKATATCGIQVATKHVRHEKRHHLSAPKSRFCDPEHPLRAGSRRDIRHTL